MANGVDQAIRLDQPVVETDAGMKTQAGKKSRLRQSTVSLGTKALSVVTLIATWWLLSLTLGDSILPSPLLTVTTLYEEILRGEIFVHLRITLTRVILAFLLAMTFGTLTGCALGLSKRISRFFDLWVAVGTSIPALVYIVVLFLWLGLTESSAIIAACMVTVFNITYNVWEGVKSLDSRFTEMGTVFGASRQLQFRRIVLPQLTPYLMASARFSLGLTWKLMIFVELMGRPSGIGYMINRWYQLYNMASVLSYAALFILVMLAIESFLSHVVEPWLFRWRPTDR